VRPAGGVLRFLAAFALLPSLACRERVDAPPPAPPGGAASRETEYSTGDPALDALQKDFLPTLEANRKEFTGQMGLVRGFGAGTVYPQVWLRDSATMIPATRHHYSGEWLTSWLEEHLSHQRRDGQLWDWIAAGEPVRFKVDAPGAGQVYRAGTMVLTADKNTTATDQETSAILAAGDVFALTEDRDWLGKKILGQRLLDRLDAALDWVRRERLTKGGLVTAALTADWGDVAPFGSDNRAVYVDERTPMVEGLYVSVMTFRAAEVLGQLFEATGEPERAGFWREAAGQIRTSINRRLWQEDRGFYRFQLPMPGPKPPRAVDAQAMFALGGNALAMLYGVADPRQAARIVAAAEERQRRYGVSTIAGVLLPPFPRNFFEHPMQREEWSYQNGGQWDWWAGRFLLAEFRAGQAEAALRQLLEIAQRVKRSGGLYEWYTPAGEGRDSPHYAGSVGALSAAIDQGLFGIDSRKGGLDLTVRLGAVAGRVRVLEPAISRRIVYDYRYDPGRRVLRLRLETDAPGAGTLRLRLPDGVPAHARIDGKEVPFTTEAIGRDAYVVLPADWRAREVEVRLR
jgi:hypothetical protein